jgi:hypothetical protein
MSIGGDVKVSVDALRDKLGSSCVLNGVTALGKCSYRELSPGGAREIMGSETIEELDGPWVIIEVPANSNVKEQDSITVTVTGKKWTVRRVIKPLVADVVIAERCICTGDLIG